jgi:hypothetical protein
MTYRWLLLILMLTTACGKPALKVPIRHLPKQEQKEGNKPIIAPIPFYGNKIV